MAPWLLCGLTSVSLAFFASEPVHGQAAPTPQTIANREVAEVIERILGAVGRPGMRIRAQADDELTTAGSSLEYGQRVVWYNPSFLAQVASRARTDWPIVFILSHEVGHHLRGHLIPPYPSREGFLGYEQEANEVAGFVLARLGATLAESTNAAGTVCLLATVSPVPRARCEDAARRGWQVGAK